MTVRRIAAAALLPALLQALLPGLLVLLPVPGRSAQAASPLDEGRTAAAGCLPLLEEDTLGFGACIEHRAAAVAARPEAPADAAQRRLGTLWVGWFIADAHAAHGLEDADAVADRLFAPADALREAQGLAPAALCPLVELPCAQVLARRQTRLQRLR